MADISDVGDISRILVSGIDDSAKPYLDNQTMTQLKDTALRHVGRLVRLGLSKWG